MSRSKILVLQECQVIATLHLLAGSARREHDADTNIQQGWHRDTGHALYLSYLLACHASRLNLSVCAELVTNACQAGSGAADPGALRSAFIESADMT